MIAISILRPATMLDYQEYKEAFDFETIRMEPTFIFMTWLIKSFSGNFIILISFYALLGISLKLWFIHKYSISFWLSILIYISNYFILHDMIQMRVSISGVLFLMAISQLENKNKRNAFLLTLLSVFFHYSSIVLFPFLLMNSRTINKLFYFSLIPISYCLSLMNLGLPFIIRNVDIELVQKAFDSYENSLYIQDATLNIFNAVQLFKIFIAILLLNKIGIIVKRYPMSIILLKIYIISISIYALFSEMPVIAQRLSELLGVVEILLIPCLYCIFVQKKIGEYFVIFISFSILVLNIFYNNLLQY